MTYQLDPNIVHFIPLGGAEEFGCNFNLYAYKGKWLIMDCGMGFADQRSPMIDILLPKPDFIEQFKDDIVGLVVTHAHEDHIGAVPHLWHRLRCPVFCSPFTSEVLRRKNKEFPKTKGMPINVVRANDKLGLGPFELSFLSITHSVPENLSTAIGTDQGIILHTGDWNLDPDPQIGHATSPQGFKDIGEKGVLAYVGDSTNALVAGRTPSESEVEKGLTKVFAKQKNRIVVTTFSSNIGRIRSIAKAAEANNRSVCVVGRSLHNMVGAAKENGFLDDLQDFISEGDMKQLGRDQVVLIVTGSQGEARAALSRIARGQFKGIRIEPNDTVIFSSRNIPGNEKEINAVKNDLTASGIEVISERQSEHIIHVSGHPCRDELKDMLSWAKPKIAIPVHGERMMTEAHGLLAQDMGVEHVIIPSNGAVIALDPENPEIIDYVETGFIGVEPKRLIDLDNDAIRERYKLQFTGAVFITACVDGRGHLLFEADVTTMGLEENESDAELQLIENIQGDVEEALSSKGNEADWEEYVRIIVRRRLNDIYGFKPHVVVHIIQGED